MSDRSITVCITSYDRFDLLKQTVDSFNKLNTFPIDRMVIIEDSTKPYMKDNILKEYGDKVDLIFNEQRIGQAPSLDKMYNTVTTKYIFHTEDDYLYSGNANFLKDAIEILEERPDVHQIWVKHFSDFVGESRNQFENEVLKTSTGIEYKMLKSSFGGGGGWCGFSFYPHVKRTQDYKDFFKEGYGKFISPEYLVSGVQTEAACNTHAKAQGYRAAYLLNTAGSHTGINGRQTYK